MLLVNTENLGKEYEVLELVSGSTIQSKNAIKDIGQSFKTIVGGELKSYTKMMEEARNIATKRMIEKAESLNADAIINVRFTSSTVTVGAAEILVYGTAVKIVK